MEAESAELEEEGKKKNERRIKNRQSSVGRWKTWIMQIHVRGKLKRDELSEKVVPWKGKANKGRAETLSEIRRSRLDPGC